VSVDDVLVGAVVATPRSTIDSDTLNGHGAGVGGDAVAYGKQASFVSR